MYVIAWYYVVLCEPLGHNYEGLYRFCTHL